METTPDSPQTTHHPLESGGAEASSAPASFLVPIARDVPMSAIARWLARGWRDLMRSYLTGVWFGVCFVAMGTLLALAFKHAPASLMALISGFLLIGPFICVGCYAISYALERGKQPEIKRAALAFRNNAKNIAIFAFLSRPSTSEVAVLTRQLATLIDSGLRYSIVRPTAFFKSLSGQIERVQRGRPFLLFGDGTLTSCKPISDSDLADYIAGCLTDEDRWNRILPIGGPGSAITPRDQGEAMFALLGRPPKFRSVPVALLDGIAGALGLLGHIVPRLAEKAELARIGRYYATESMLVLDPKTGRYDAAATPSTGTETLLDFYRSVLSGTATPERGAHAVF